MGTHVTEESWFGRIGGAIKGILFGGLLAILSVPLLFWNEGRAVRTAKGLKEGASVVVDIQPESVDPANDGKFVHLSGDTSTSESLQDHDFAVSYDGIRLTRNVETYQWHENSDTRTEKKLGGGKRRTTEYTYEKGWHKGLIDSTEFDEPDHKNPTQTLFAEQVRQANDVRVGEFRLPDSLIDMIRDEQAYKIEAANIPEALRQRAVIRNDGENGQATLYIAAETAVSSTPAGAASEASPDPNRETPTENKPVSEEDQEVLDLIAPHVQDTATTENASAEDTTKQATSQSATVSRDPSVDPQIGDVRVWFTTTPVGPVSLLSQQTGNGFSPFETHYGTTIHTLENGIISSAEMIAHAESANRVMTWAIRAGGSFIMFLGLVLILRPLAVVADVLPFLGSLVGFGSMLIAGLLTIAGATTVIAIAWIVYRPLLGISLLVVAAIALYLIFSRGKKRRGGGPETLTASDLA
ncbi:TMEM43 family protein [Rhodopirellula sp. MGV]|uniref:TMEM43 family protein n=1 Tax=Rhodopirellula sp. MGV TaxID=2023130 RepID=UPI000B969A1E|nr:TMEM43 family protein [Rhodopirellula sp. MGV]OYP36738.1 hypothetical protein CGZ80_07505 [Rhodopirellula sp. MGV]PNY34431.1 hypothetical protein C2E31_23575 [Rhodopirellula baltica]